MPARPELAARRGFRNGSAASDSRAGYLRDGGVYRDLGQAYFDERDRTRITERLLQRLRTLGVAVEVQPTAA